MIGMFDGDAARFIATLTAENERLTAELADLRNRSERHAEMAVQLQETKDALLEDVKRLNGELRTARAAADRMCKALHEADALGCGTPEDGIRKLAEDLRTAREERDEAEAISGIMLDSAKELAEILHEKWKVPGIDALTIFMSAILTGIADEWKKNPPENGIVHTANFLDERLTLTITREGGKSPAEVINRLNAEVAAQSRQIAEALKFVLEAGHTNLCAKALWKETAARAVNSGARPPSEPGCTCGQYMATVALSPARTAEIMREQEKQNG